MKNSADSVNKSKLADQRCCPECGSMIPLENLVCPFCLAEMKRKKSR